MLVHFCVSATFGVDWIVIGWLFSVRSSSKSVHTHQEFGLVLLKRGTRGL